MITAEAIYRRHIAGYCKAEHIQGGVPSNITSVIYAACIVVEAIRNEMSEEFDPPKQP